MPGRRWPAWPGRRTRIQLGTLVSPVTFRIPGEFAKVVATVDEMSGGRVEVGVGAGWNEDEHAQLGLPYPDTKTRVDQMEEELTILRGLWDEPDGWSFEGVHWQVRGSLFRPRYDGSRPRADGRRRPNIIVGGTGKPRSLRLAAKYADEYNASGSSPGRGRGHQRATWTRPVPPSGATRGPSPGR